MDNAKIAELSCCLTGRQGKLSALNIRPAGSIVYIILSSNGTKMDAFSHGAYRESDSVNNP